MRVLFVSANREQCPSPVIPLGVLYVAAAARVAGHEVALADLCFEAQPEQALAAELRRFAPDVVGVGLRNLAAHDCGGSDTLVADYAGVVRVIRQHTAAPIIVGGSAFSLQPARMLEELGADFGVVGEGEWILPRLLAQLARGETPSRLTRSAATPGSACALDALVWPARELVDPRYFRDGDGTVGVQSKRGCAFACAYCDYPDLEGRMVRVRAPEAVADEIAHLAEAGRTRHVFFVDSVFNVPRRHALAVCRALAIRGAPLPWTCYASPRGLDGELAEAMARAGCVGVEIGADAGSDEGLARLRKPFGIADVVLAHLRLRTCGIFDCHSFVLGACDEPLAESERTLEFADELDPDAAVFVVFHEEREQRVSPPAEERASLLALLAERAPRHDNWIVPQLGHNAGYPARDAGAPHVRRAGPPWLRLARLQRARRQLAH